MMRSQPLVIHIGLPKTGSTFLQREVFPLIPNVNFHTSHGNTLPHEFGWVYRMNGPWLNNSISRETRRKKIEKIFETEKAKLFTKVGKQPCESATCPFTVISSEGFAGVSPDPILNADLSAKLMGIQRTNVKIVLILRRQDTWCSSIYRQLVFSEDRYRRFLEFHELFGLSESDKAGRVPVTMLAWDRLVETYQLEFGKENVLVLPFELFLDDSNTFVSSICKFMGVDTPTGIGFGRHVNVRAPVSVYHRGGLTQRLKQVLGGLRDGNNRFLYEILGVINDIRTMGRYEGRVYCPPKPEVLASIMENMKESNKRLSKICDFDFGYYGYH